MADKKISQLTGASTPLAGTEVLPIVQSGSTVKVASDDLTVKNVRSNATTGILQIAGPGAGATRTMTVPNANFTAARTDAAQTFTGDQTFGKVIASDVEVGTSLDSTKIAVGIDGAADGTTYGLNKWTPRNTEATTYDLKLTTRFAGAGATAGWQYDFVTRDFYTGSKTYLRFLGGNTVLPDGNLVIGTAAKGIDFSANTGAAGETSALLNWYEEGTWTPTVIGTTSAGTATYSTQRGGYTRVGRMVSFQIYLVWSGGTGTGDLRIAGLPFTSANNDPVGFGAIMAPVMYVPLTAGSSPSGGYVLSADTKISLLQVATGGAAPAAIPYSASGEIMVAGSYYV